MIKQHIPKVSQNEKGLIMPLILMLLLLGTLFLVPAIILANPSLLGKRVQSNLLAEQYTLDGGAEFAIWNIIYGKL